MNAQEAIVKRIEEIDKIEKRYDAHIKKLRDRLRESNTDFEQHNLKHAIEGREDFLWGKLEVKEELEAILNASTGSDRENGTKIDSR